MKYLWVIGGGLMQVPVVEKAHDMGYGVIVSDMNPNCACHSIADVFLSVDIFDIKTHRELAKDSQDVVGVIACGIDAPETASWIAHDLNLPAATPEIARICHNKHEFRKAMRHLGYPTPKYSVFDKPNWQWEISYPLIVKNTDNSGSRGTSIFMTPPTEQSTNEAIQNAINASKSGKAIVEELWTGTEHTVETLVINESLYPCFITDRHFDYSSGYPIETGLRHPSVLPEYLQCKAYELAKNIATDFRIINSPLKLDIMVTDDGIRIIEATTRLSGGFDCQYLVPYATGKDIIGAYIQMSVGSIFFPEWDLLIDKKGLVGVTGSMFPKQGKIKKIDDSEARKVKGVKEIFWRYAEGDTIEPYIDCAKRVNFIICVGETEEMAYGALEEAKQKIILEVE
jgi:biotin carboxylase